MIPAWRISKAASNAASQRSVAGQVAPSATFVATVSAVATGVCRHKWPAKYVPVPSAAATRDQAVLTCCSLLWKCATCTCLPSAQ
jgi:hypothetical protein